MRWAGDEGDGGLEVLEHAPRRLQGLEERRAPGGQLGRRQIRWRGFGLCALPFQLIDNRLSFRTRLEQRLQLSLTEVQLVVAHVRHCISTATQ